jgi:hypothetical protein
LPILFGTGTNRTDVTLDSESNAEYQISFQHHFIGPAFLMELLTTPEREVEALNAIIDLLQTSSLVHSHVLATPCLDHLFSMLRSSILRPKKFKGIKDLVWEIWSNLCAPTLAPKLLDYIPDLALRLLSIISEDRMKHQKFHGSLFTWVKLGIGLPGDKQILLTLLPLIETSINILIGISDYSQTPSFQDPAKKTKSPTEFQMEQEQHISSLLGLLCYFDPKYVSKVVSKQSFLVLIKEILERGLIGVLTPTFSTIRWFGKTSVPTLERHQIFDIITSQSQAGVYGPRVLDSRDLLEQFGRKVPNISITAILEAFNSTLHPHLESKFDRLLIEASKYKKFNEEEELIALINKISERLFNQPRPTLHCCFTYLLSEGHLTPRLLLRTDFLKYYASGIERRARGTAEVTWIFMKMFQQKIPAPSDAHIKADPDQYPPLEYLAQVLRSCGFWRKFGAAMDELKVYEIDAPGKPVFPELWPNGSINYQHWAMNKYFLSDTMMVTFSILTHAPANLLEEIFIDGFFDSLERLLRRYPLHDRVPNVRLGIYIWYIVVMDRMFTLLEPMFTAAIKPSPVAPSKAYSSEDPSQSAPQLVPEEKLHKLEDLKRRFARFAQNPFCLEIDQHNFKTAMASAITPLDVPYLAFFTTHEKWLDLVMRYARYEPNLLADSLHLASHIFGQDRANNHLLPLCKAYYKLLPTLFDHKLSIVAKIADYDQFGGTPPTDLTVEDFISICTDPYVNTFVNICAVVSRAFKIKQGEKGEKLGGWILWHFEMCLLVIDREIETKMALPKRETFLQNIKLIELALFTLIDFKHPSLKVGLWPKRAKYLLRHLFSLNPQQPFGILSSDTIRANMQHEFLQRLPLRSTPKHPGSHLKIVATATANASSLNSSVNNPQSHLSSHNKPPQQLFDLLDPECLLLFLTQAFLHTRTHNWVCYASHAISMTFTTSSLTDMDTRVLEVLCMPSLLGRSTFLSTVVNSLLFAQGFKFLYDPATGGVSADLVDLETFPVDKHLRFFVTSGFLRILIQMIDPLMQDQTKEATIMIRLFGALNVLIMDPNESVADLALDLYEKILYRLSPASVDSEVVARQKQRHWRYFAQYPSTKLPRWIEMQKRFMLRSSPSSQLYATSNMVFLSHIVYIYLSHLTECMKDPEGWRRDQAKRLEAKQKLVEVRWKNVVPSSLDDVALWISSRDSFSDMKYLSCGKHGIRTQVAWTTLGPLMDDTQQYLEFDLPLHIDWTGSSKEDGSHGGFILPGIVGVLLKSIGSILKEIPKTESVRPDLSSPIPPQPTRYYRGIIFQQDPLSSSSYSSIEASSTSKAPPSLLEAEAESDGLNPRAATGSRAFASRALTEGGIDGVLRHGGSRVFLHSSKQGDSEPSLTVTPTVDTTGVLEDSTIAPPSGKPPPAHGRSGTLIRLPNDLLPSWTCSAELAQPTLPIFKHATNGGTAKDGTNPVPSFTAPSVIPPAPPTQRAISSPSTQVYTFCKAYAEDVSHASGISKLLASLSQFLCSIPDNLLPISLSIPEETGSEQGSDIEEAVLDIIWRLLDEGIHLSISGQPGGLLLILQRFLLRQIALTPTHDFDKVYTSPISTLDPRIVRRNDVIVETSCGPLMHIFPDRIPPNRGFVSSHLARMIPLVLNNPSIPDIAAHMEAIFSLVRFDWPHFEKHLVPIFNTLLDRPNAYSDEYQIITIRIMPFLDLYNIIQDNQVLKAYFRSPGTTSSPSTRKPSENADPKEKSSCVSEDGPLTTVDLNCEPWRRFLEYLQRPSAKVLNPVR